jgi:thiosulfate/3-mercaptopyruvate sulfurtransferase
MAWQTLVTAEVTAARLTDPRLRIFDCRHHLDDPRAGYEAYRVEHLPGAVHAGLDEDLAAPATVRSGRHPLPAADGFAARLRAWGVSDDSLLLAYDDASGLWAARFWWMAAKWLGHPHVAVLDGGLKRWKSLGLPTTDAMPPPRPAGTFVGDPDASRAVDADTVQAAAQDPASLVLDARAAERFRGDVEPIDRVAGHVPGARNHPSSRNVTPEGTLLPPAQLRATLAATLGDVEPARVITMCGSGVTACHLLLAMEHAGLEGARLYPGSWSEWSRDPSRAVARGDA